MKMVSKIFVLLSCILLFSTEGKTAETINIYGPGGPQHALIKVAELFTKKTAIAVNVRFGPEHTWKAEALEKADMLFSASDNQMVAFIKTYSENFIEKNVHPIYLHRAIILTKKGNPKKILGLESLAQKGIRIVVNDGAGKSQTSGTGVWEDMAGRLGNIEQFSAIRKNIVTFAPNSGSARKAFVDKKNNADAWITWEDWAIAQPLIGEMVHINKSLVIARPLEIVIKKNPTKAEKEFLAFLVSKEAEKIFNTYGWYKNF